MIILDSGCLIWLWWRNSIYFLKINSNFFGDKVKRCAIASPYTAKCQGNTVRSLSCFLTFPYTVKFHWSRVPSLVLTIQNSRKTPCFHLSLHCKFHGNTVLSLVLTLPNCREMLCSRWSLPCKITRKHRFIVGFLQNAVFSPVLTMQNSRETPCYRWSLHRKIPKF